MRFKHTTAHRVADFKAEVNHRLAKRRASESGRKKAITIQPVQGPSIWRRMFDAVTGKAAATTCEKCGTRNTLKQLAKRGACLKCGTKPQKAGSVKEKA